MKTFFLFFCFTIVLTMVVGYSQWTKVNPSYVRSVFGHSVMGLDLEVYRIPERAGKPKVLIVGNIHGDEISGYDMVGLLLQQEVVPKEDRSADGLKDLDVLYVPTMNPDGMYYDMRENADRVDLNRAFPDECNRTNSTMTAESQAMMEFIVAEKPLVILVYHGGASLVVWGPEQNCTSDALSVATNVSAFETQLMTTMASIYAASLGDPIIEGSVMYQIAGSLPAFAVPRHSQLALTIEVDRMKEPTERREEWLIEKHGTALHDLLQAIQSHVHSVAEMSAKYPDEHFADNGGFVLSFE